ncbi:hypothetical protein BGZ82_001207 [Podila clonocystis]|nr:hypothetical protein BGZ82_001207 [Podila clonocystis]
MKLLTLALSLALTPLSFAQHPTRTLERRQLPEPTPTPNAFNPSAIAGSEYAFRDNQALYINGGEYASTGMNVTYRNDFYKLDLSVPWNASQAPWNRLRRPNYNQYAKERMVLSRDGGALYSGDYNIQAYITRRNVWQRTRAIESYPGSFELGSIMDQDSGIVYNLGSCNSGASLEVAPSCFLSTFETTNGDIGGDDVPWENVKNSTYRSIQGVYSQDQKSMYFLRGAEATLSTVQGKIVIMEYKTSSKTWTKLETKGDVPDNRIRSCFAASHGGAKLILTGGGKPPETVNARAPRDTNVALKDIYMLDVATATWTKLPDAPSPYYKPVCAVSGDSLILYGGYSAHAGETVNGTIVTNGNDPSIFNLGSNTWVKEYKPSTTSGAYSEASGARSSYSNAAFVVFLVMAFGM